MTDINPTMTFTIPEIVTRFGKYLDGDKWLIERVTDKGPEWTVCTSDHLGHVIRSLTSINALTELLVANKGITLCERIALRESSEELSIITHAMNKIFSRVPDESVSGGTTQLLLYARELEDIDLLFN